MVSVCKTPYLQDMKTDRVIIMWQTEGTCETRLQVWETLRPRVPANPFTLAGQGRIYTGAPGEMHRVLVDGLKPASTYAYQLLDEQMQPVGEMYPFRTAPEEDAAISFVLTAEYGGGSLPDNPTAQPIVDLIRHEHPDFILSVGDIVDDGRIEGQWGDYLFGLFGTLMSSTPFYPCIGNHELGGETIRPDNEAAVYANYNKYFALPHYYSFDYGSAHFCVLDAPYMFDDFTTDENDNYIPHLKPGLMESDQIRFLKEDLAASKAKWKFVIFHYPPYTSAIFDLPQLQCLSPIFEENGVDIVFNSHVIAYERTHPLRGGRIAPDGVRYILVGGYIGMEQWFWPKTNGLTVRQAGNRPGYVRVSLSPWRLELQAIDWQGRLFDTLTIDK